MQIIPLVLILLLIPFAGLPAPASAQQPVPILDASSMGDQVSLEEGWLFHGGDDPAWSSPYFDDSGWTRIHPREDPARYVAPADTRYGWLRLHVHLRPGGPPPVFGIPRSFGRYQVFANGRLLGTVGDLNQHTLYDRDQMTQFPIPPEALARPAEGGADLVLALRWSMQKPTYKGQHLTRLFPDPPLLGTSRVLGVTGMSFRVLEVVPLGVNLLPSLVVGFIAFALFLAVRNRREYLLLGLLCLALAADSFWQYYTWATPFDLAGASIEGCVYFAEDLAIIAFLRELLGRRFPGAYAFLFVVAVATASSFPVWAVGTVPGNALSLEPYLWLIFYTVSLILLAHAFWRGTPGFRRDAWPVLLGFAMQTLGYFKEEVGEIAQSNPSLPRFLAYPRLFVGPFSIDFSIVGQALLILCLLFFLIARTVRIARERNQAAAEIEAAQTVQRLLLSRSSLPTPGFLVDRVYRPANEVGGDFFLVSPGEEDGSLVAIVGDVSGKGLAAAMNVSMILGVLRNEPSRSPAVVLRHLNDSLLAQGAAGFTTACCVHLTKAGDYVIANAGHLAPYLSGAELETPPALPLGIAPDQDYESISGRMLRDQRMALLTDGIPEARASNGKLMGFDNLGVLTCAPAEEIADAAQAFGQEDDITVVTIALQI